VVIRTDLAVAFMLLTRLPMGWLASPEDPPDQARCIWAFPLVGITVGLAGGLSYDLTSKVGVPPLLAAIWSFAVMLAISGGLHEDGLADTVDGFGGGATPTRKMEIMRDSRIGSFGTLALLVSSLIRVAAVAAIAHPDAVFKAFLVAGTLGRSAMVLPLIMLPAARPDGMAASLGRPCAMSSVVAFVVAGLLPLVCLPVGRAVIVIGLAAASALAITRLARSQINGHTGDVIGATEVTVECVVLTVLASAMNA
jgi:adenosylcobinamide-GDP ribazoletransferase